jgi:uncharacterized membrane protein
MQRDKTDNNPNRTALIKTVDCLCAVLLIGCTLWVAFQYGSLPDKIPVHYNINGIADGYGSKNTIWIPVGFMWLITGLTSITEQFLIHWNPDFKSLDSKHRQQMLAIRPLVNTTKLVIAAMFTYITIMSVLGKNLSVYFIPVLFAILGANHLYWITRFFRNK